MKPAFTGEVLLACLNQYRPWRAVSRLTHLWALPEKDQTPAVDSGTTWTSAGLWFPVRKRKKNFFKAIGDFQIFAARLKNKNKSSYLKYHLIECCELCKTDDSQICTPEANNTLYVNKKYIKNKIKYHLIINNEVVVKIMGFGHRYIGWMFRGGFVQPVLTLAKFSNFSKPNFLLFNVEIRMPHSDLSQGLNAVVLRSVSQCLACS